MSIIVRNGVTYDTNDLRNYAAYEIITAGTGDEQERFIAILTDSIADAGNSLVTQSLTSLTVGTGSQVFVLEADVPLVPGLRFSLIDNVTPGNKMHGEVTTYDPGTKTVDGNVDIVEGSGTFAVWDFKGGVGATGATGSTNIVDDTTPQLGGNLDGQGFNITDVVLPKFPSNGTVLLEVGEDTTKQILRNVQRAQTLLDFIGETVSGTITAELKINGVITATLTVSSVSSNDNTFVDDSLAVGDDLTVTYSVNASAVDTFLEIVGEETLVVPA